MDEDCSDERLMLAYRDGDAKAFEALYRRYRGALHRYLTYQCGNPAVAEELYQDVWIKVVNARADYEPLARFSTWIFRIAHHRLLDHYRKAALSLPPALKPMPQTTPILTTSSPDKPARSRKRRTRCMNDRRRPGASALRWPSYPPRNAKLFCSPKKAD